MGELGQNNKYYTPTIDEFHVGFEYEVFDTKYSYEVQHIKEDQYKVLSEPKQVSDWYKEKYTLDRFIYVENSETAYNGLNDYIEDGEIRVKYLDKEDIESLGWENVENRGMSENYGYSFQKPILYLSGGNAYYRLRYWYTNHRVRIEPLGGPIFDGTIKNKSELKVLLRQLGIC